MKTLKITCFLQCCLFAMAVLCIGPTTVSAGTYTLDADFDQGIMVSVNHDSPNNDQLQLNLITEPFPFVNIACSARGTVVRIDVNTGAILGEYNSAPDRMGKNPSRTTVDQFGNVWVANRAEFGESPSGSGVSRGSITRIGLIIGGTRVDSGGNPDANGQYLAPPYDYNTCIDRDFDGLIKTSRGLGDYLPWDNAGGADTHGGVATAEDEAILNYTRVTGTGTRTIAIDANNDVWVGGYSNQEHEKVDGITGLPVSGTQFNVGCGGYGGLIDGNGVLWSASSGLAGGALLRYDTTTNTWQCLTGIGDYGLGIDPVTGNIWHSSLSYSPDVFEIAPDGTMLNSYVQGFGAQGVAVDGSSHVWVAEIFGDEVAHFAPDPCTPGQHIFVGNVTGFGGTTGVAVDTNGKIWASEMHTSTASRIDPTAGLIGGGGYAIGAIDMTVDLNDPCNPNLPNAGPYNYSDMTGFVVTSSTAPQGTWNIVYDTGADDTEDCRISWNNEPEGATPAGTGIDVETRAANIIANLPAELFVSVANGGASGVSGRYMEIRTTLWRDPGVDDTPVLSDLDVTCNEPPDCSEASANPACLWPPNHKMVPVSITGVTDPDGDPVTIVITGITSDEATASDKGAGGAKHAPDADGVGTDTAELRAERSGKSNGRVYVISFTASDGKGGECEGSVQVNVPHDQRPARRAPAPCEADDDGQNYDATEEN